MTSPTIEWKSVRVTYNPPKKDQKKGVPYPPSPAIKEIADSVRTC
jgi:hypothetical protein